MPTPVDRCEICGRFVGRYPIGFYCDTHCARCICTQCPGFRQPPSVSTFKSEALNAH